MMTEQREYLFIACLSIQELGPSISTGAFKIYGCSRSYSRLPEGF
jgi:hypothetical protein